jgi:plasmid stabilization system protein ParE
MGRAKNDLRHIIIYRIDNDLPDPLGYAQGLRARIKQLHDLRHPGKRGRKAGTREWVLAPFPYSAVFKQSGNDVKIYRVLHGSRQWP